MSTVDRWLDVTSADVPGTLPIWLVAIRGSGLAVRDVVSLPGLESHDVRPVVGAFFGWDAATGLTILEGALMTEADLDALAKLASQDLVIRPWVPPEIPTLDPGRSPALDAVLTPPEVPTVDLGPRPDQGATLAPEVAPTTHAGTLPEDGGWLV
jgi:hypothetical protein